ncbi:ribonuclease H-like domain-containing protein [Favolaschia claudopus]|uniref:ribonuclease H n=1 Tax=Favolaschia claudopus TaxID=2862362 RepID=A0AAV9ZPV6_9AGAR
MDTARADMERVISRGGSCIFTDGSGFEDGAGAAAVVATGRGVGAKRQKHLGSMGEHTVFESEVCGAILALDIIADIPRLTDVDIFLDCQPAIAALSSPKPQPGQYLLAAFRAVLGRILSTRRTLKIRLRWVPAHVGIVGNELVDTLAKEAAQGATTALKTRIKVFESPLPTSRAAVIAAGAKAFAKRWDEEWRTSPRYTRVASFD